ncbi:MAG: hypothetical protein VCD31_03470 [Alphaproteobacteria bacterium]
MTVFESTAELSRVIRKLLLSGVSVLQIIAVHLLRFAASSALNGTSPKFKLNSRVICPFT